MMIIPALSLLLAFQTAAPATAEYKNPELDLAFSHPASWVFTTKKGAGKAVIPLPDSQTATLEIYGVSFNSEPDLWQSVQADFLKQLKREVTRQWQEEILGVPLLLTRGGYQDKGKDLAILTGLMYSQTPLKMLFRLTAPAADYDDLEYQLRNSLQTLHTIDGVMPKPESPGRVITPEEAKVKPVLAPPKVTLLLPAKSLAKPVKGRQEIDVETGGKKLQLRFEDGWTAEKDANGNFVLRSPTLTGSVLVSVSSILDSDSPPVALFKASSKSLDEFQKVAQRRETAPTPNAAGALESTIWRTGSSAKGPLTSCEAVGLLDNFYWLATYRFEGAFPAPQQKLLDGLLASMSVELAP